MGENFTISTIAGNIVTIADTIVPTMGTIMSTITGNALLSFFALSGFLGVGIGLVSRVLKAVK